MSLSPQPGNLVQIDDKRDKVAYRMELAARASIGASIARVDENLRRYLPRGRWWGAAGRKLSKKPLRDVKRSRAMTNVTGRVWKGSFPAPVWSYLSSQRLFSDLTHVPNLEEK